MLLTLVQSVYTAGYFDFHEKEGSDDFSGLYFLWMPTDSQKLQKFDLYSSLGHNDLLYVSIEYHTSQVEFEQK